jgi:FkbM family methyltransferase
MQILFFLDIGANIGLFSLLVSATTGARSLAFELVRSTFHAMVRNCSSNPHLPITPLNLALGSDPALVEMTAVPCSGINQIVTVAEREGEPRQLTPQLALDQLCLDSLLVPGQRLVIKIDVERYEFAVLKGALKLLSQDRPIVICIEAPAVEKPNIEALLGPAFRLIYPSPTPKISDDLQAESEDFFYANEAWPGV